jgi:hypothetical protein
MTEYRQLVNIDLQVIVPAGSCLVLAQDVFSAPVAHPSATAAYNATTDRHTGPLPNVAIPVWFSHFGTYGNPPTYGDWGHVVAWIPHRGFLSSPTAGEGNRWWLSIDAIEKAYNCKYLAWTTDINGLSVAAPLQNKQEGDIDMIVIKHTDRGRYYLLGAGFISAAANDTAGKIAADMLAGGSGKGTAQEVSNASGAVTALLQMFGIPKSTWEGLKPGESWSNASQSIPFAARGTTPSSAVDTDALLLALKSLTFKAI